MERIVLLAIIVLVTSSNLTSAQEYIPGYEFKHVNSVLQSVEFTLEGKDEGEIYTAYYYEKWVKAQNHFMVNVYAKENGKISRIRAEVNNVNLNEKLSKDFLQMIGSFLSGGATKKFNDKLSPWIIQNYKEGGETTFRGVKVELITSSPSWKMLRLSAGK